MHMEATFINNDTRISNLLYEYTPTDRRNVGRPRKNAQPNTHEGETSLECLILCCWGCYRLCVAERNTEHNSCLVHVDKTYSKYPRRAAIISQRPVLFKDFSIVNFEHIFFPSQRTLEFSSEQVGPSAETPHTTTASSKVNRLIPFRLSHLPHPPDTMTVHPMHVVSPDWVSSAATSFAVRRADFRHGMN